MERSTAEQAEIAENSERFTRRSRRFMWFLQPVFRPAIIAGLLILAPQTASAARWPAGAVIRVWIDPVKAPAGSDDLVERAMKTWTGAAQGRFRLERAAGDR